MIQFPVRVASILTIHRFIDVFNVFLFGSDSQGPEIEGHATPTCVFPPAFLIERWRHFGGAGGAPASQESALGRLTLGVRSSVFKFPQALLSQFPQHPEKHRTTNPPIKC